MDQNLITADDLKLYQIYNIRYVRPMLSGGRLVTPRALFLGLFDKKNSVSADFLSIDTSKESSTLASYLGIWFLTYCPAASPDDFNTIKDSFEFVFCHPEKGMSKPEGSNIITISPHYCSVKTIYPRNDMESKKAFEKLRLISRKTGLIDTSLEALAAKAPSKLTNSVIRNLHRGLTKLVEKT